MFDLLKSSSLPNQSYAGPLVHLRAPRRRDELAWLELRSASKDFLEPWEPLWPRDALTPQAYRRRLNRVERDWRAQSGYGLFIFDNKNKDLLGGISFANVRRGVVESANIGYWIGAPHARKGYMQEALQISLDFAFRVLRLHRVEAACLIHNEASRNLLLKSGFQLEGRARKYLCIAGRWQDHDTFGILRTDDRPALPVREV